MFRKLALLLLPLALVLAACSPTATVTPTALPTAVPTTAPSPVPTVNPVITLTDGLKRTVTLPGPAVFGSNSALGSLPSVALSSGWTPEPNP